LIEPDRKATEDRVIRLDQFTPKAFVSHAANRKPEQLAKIDLLPKLKDKTLLVKELAPIFRGREDSLRGTSRSSPPSSMAEVYCRPAALTEPEDTRDDTYLT
jgi:hypothetical protein